MSEPTCYGCKYLADTLGNYVECKKTAETGTHMFVDWYYWNDGSPDKCPLKAKKDGSERKQYVPHTPLIQAHHLGTYKNEALRSLMTGGESSTSTEK